MLDLQGKTTKQKRKKCVKLLSSAEWALCGGKSRRWGEWCAPHSSKPAVKPLFQLSPFRAGLLHYLSVSRGLRGNSQAHEWGRRTGPAWAEQSRVEHLWSISSPVASGLIQHHISIKSYLSQSAVFTRLQGHSHSVCSFKKAFPLTVDV